MIPITISKENRISQEDIIKNIQFDVNYFIDNKKTLMENIHLDFNLVIVLSQDCDMSNKHFQKLKTLHQIKN
jgi:hypothetical protein